MTRTETSGAVGDIVDPASRGDSIWRRPLRPLGRVARWLYFAREHLLLYYDLDRPVPPRSARAPVTFRAAQSREVAGLGADPAHEVSEESRRLHEHLLAEGARCTIGLVGDRIVYHGWCTRGRWRVAGSLSVPLPSDTAIIFRCFTTKEFRGLGIYGAALAHELALLSREGCRRVLINVEVGNAISRRAIERIGFVPLGTYRVTCLAGSIKASLPEALRRGLWPGGEAQAPR